MSAKALLEELRGRGLELAADGDRLLYRPKHPITSGLLNALAEHKLSLLKLLEWERRKLEEAHRRGFVTKWSREPGWISLHDPLTGVWHDWPAADCFPSIVAEANRRRKKGGVA